jgi:pyruvate/2-oxoglutarate/acetoin dehydrogenase E1 component
MDYRSEVTRAMIMLGEIPNTIFLGQSVCYSGNVMYSTLKGIPDNKKLELPVIEDTQMGMSIGLSLAGYLPVSIFPRMDFILCCINQLVNHLDKIEALSEGRFKPKVIIRTLIGTKTPLDSGLQHTGDYRKALKAMLKNVEVVSLDCPESIFPCYVEAVKSKQPTILVEKGELYDVTPNR